MYIGRWKSHRQMATRGVPAATCRAPDSLATDAELRPSQTNVCDMVTARRGRQPRSREDPLGHRQHEPPVKRPASQPPSRAVAAACFRARLAGEPSPTGRTGRPSWPTTARAAVRGERDDAILGRRRRPSRTGRPSCRPLLVRRPRQSLHRRALTSLRRIPTHEEQAGDPAAGFQTAARGRRRGRDRPLRPRVGLAAELTSRGWGRPLLGREGGDQAGEPAGNPSRRATMEASPPTKGYRPDSCKITP